MAGTLTMKGQATAPVQKGRSPLSDAWRQLLQNRVAVVSGIFIIALIFVAIFAEYVAPHPYDGANFQFTDEPPFSTAENGDFYLLGTDKLGRGNLSRTIYGTRISLGVAFVASSLSLLIGLGYGLLSGYGSSARDNLMMRIVDFLYGFPFIVFIILVQVVVKAYSSQGDVSGIWGSILAVDRAMGGVFIMFIAIGVISWLGMARIARGQVLSLKNKEFVEAAHAIGTTDRRILTAHILPNILGPCIVYETLAIPGYILSETFLSFIGLGANPPTPSWGIMISDSVGALRTAPWEVFVPAAALTLTVLAFNFLGDGLRDAFDPRLRGE
ncbi:MAG: ABC transporter permease [Caldilineaceae bacterium]|nr:ABC transporter permease [Caldilineaceae bacterium]